jgi:hypothetical protein
LLAAFNYIPGREPWTSRYLYGGAVFIILIGADLLRGVRFRRWWLVTAAGVTAGAVIANLAPLREGRDMLDEQAVLTRADLAAIDIARGTVDPRFELSPELAGTPSLIDVTAGKYLSAAGEYGSPAYTPAELASAPEAGRRQADIVLAGALPISTETIAGRRPPRNARCVIIPGGEGGAGSSVPLSAGTTRIVLSPGPDAGMALGRYAEGEYPYVTSGAPGGSTTLLRIPADTSARRWRLHIDARQAARVCRTR